MSQSLVLAGGDLFRAQCIAALNKRSVTAKGREVQKAENNFYDMELAFQQPILAFEVTPTNHRFCSRGFSLRRKRKNLHLLNDEEFAPRALGGTDYSKKKPKANLAPE